MNPFSSSEQLENPFTIDEYQSLDMDSPVATSMTKSFDGIKREDQSTATLFESTHYQPPKTVEFTSIREAELQAREEQLSQRERDLEQRTNTLNSNGMHLPNWHAFRPLIYLDIAVEIPEEHQEKVTKLYLFWKTTVGLFALNALFSSILFFSGPKQLVNSIGDFSGSLIYCTLDSLLS